MTTTSFDNNAKNDFSTPVLPSSKDVVSVGNITISNLSKDYSINTNNNNTKRKRVNLNVRQKLELIDKLEAGIPVKQVCIEYGIKRQTVSDIRKKKYELRQFVAKYTTNLLGQQSTTTTNISGICKRKNMKVARDNDFENAVYQWYLTQITNGNNVKSCDIRNMALKIADDMNLYSFKASDGWLWRFRKRLNIARSKTKQQQQQQQQHDNYDSNPTINRTSFDFISIDNDNKHKNIVKQEQYDTDEDYTISIENIKNDLDGDCSMSMNITQIKQYTDIIMDYIRQSSDIDLQSFLIHFNNFRRLLTKKQ